MYQALSFEELEQAYRDALDFLRYDVLREIRSIFCPSATRATVRRWEDTDHSVVVDIDFYPPLDLDDEDLEPLLRERLSQLELRYLKHLDPGSSPHDLFEQCLHAYPGEDTGTWVFNLAAQRVPTTVYRNDSNSSIENKGVLCPFCESDDIEAGPADADELLTQQVRCKACTKQWRDYYERVGYEEL
jgi:hypothetical protein